MTKFAPDEAINLIARCKLTPGERVELYRVGGSPKLVWPNRQGQRYRGHPPIQKREPPHDLPTRTLGISLR